MLMGNGSGDKELGMKKICHITSGHNPYDVRIFLKECCSLVRSGYNVDLVIHGSSEIKNGVNIIGLGEKPSSRIKRMVVGSYRATKMALRTNADVFHFHDPEMLLHAKRLKKSGAVVIFDSHEDVPLQILSKHWIPSAVRKIVSRIYKKYETSRLKYVDCVVAATPHIAEQFVGRIARIVTVNNFPMLDDIVFHSDDFSERESLVCYVGGISEIRGEKVMAEAIEGVSGTLVIAGGRADASLPVSMTNVEYPGFLDRDAVNHLYGKSVAGLVVLLPEKGYMESLPVKMFEYMAAGLPVIASDFPLWREIINKYKCGICVSPENSEEVKQAIELLLVDRERARDYGRNGRKAVDEHFNWANEEAKLLCAYNEILSSL